MVEDNCLMCDSVLKLTEQTTSHQLHIETLNEMRKLPNVTQLSGFEVRMRADVSADISLMAYADFSEHDVIEMEKNTHLRTCIATQKIQCEDTEHGKQWYVPVERTKENQDVWVIAFSGEVDAESMRRLNLLADVYGNCDAHISSQKEDPLTGLENRQALSERLRRVLHLKSSAHRRSHDTTFLPSLCVLDIDFFKRVNDKFGHLYGDEVLLLFTGLMKETFRDNDYLYRYGGEEFVVLLDTHNEAETVAVLERFRQAIDDYDFPQVGHVTVSIGFVGLSSGALPSSLFDQADKALYYAKEHGRNQVHSYDKLLKAGLIEEEKNTIDSELF